MKTGRPNKYFTNVLPRFNEIKEWLRAGATDKEIASKLGVNPKVLCKYKNDYNDLNELFTKGRQDTVQEIKAALFKRAVGFTYIERKVTESERFGKTEETYMKQALPDPTAALMLLKHWDKETEWCADPATIRLREKELELKKQHMDAEW